MKSAHAHSSDSFPLEFASDSQSIEIRPYLVKNLLECGTIAVLYGESGTGKSSLALELAQCLADGRPFLGYITSRCSVLYVAAEGGRGLLTRLAALRRERGDSDAVGLLRASVRLSGTSDTDIQRLVKTVHDLEQKTGLPCGLIVIDTLSKCLVGDENSAADMAQLLRMVDLLRVACETTIVLVHHAGKNPKQGARGHSSLRAAADTELRLSGLRNPRRLAVTKQRDLPSIEPISFDLQPQEVGRDAEGEAVTACLVQQCHQRSTTPRAHGDQQDRLLKHLEALQAKTDQPLAWSVIQLRTIGREELSMHKSSARDAVTGLVNRACLVEATDGYRLAGELPGRVGTKWDETHSFDPNQQGRTERGA
jgi:RecA-family ATPase